jgi:vacuolar-type H+-ATPase subunit H
MVKERKKSHVQESLNEIRKAEKKAVRIIHTSREKTASAIIQKAHKDAGDIKEKVLKEALKQAQDAKSKIIKKATGDAARVNQEAKHEVLALKRTARNAMPDAIAKTQKKIMAMIKKESW